MEVAHSSEEALTDPPASIPSSPTSPLTTARPSIATGNTMESKAISVASNECSSALSSPAEASPAKAAGTPSSMLEETMDQSPATSQMASASDSLKSPGTSLISITETYPWVSTLSPTTFGYPLPTEGFPAVLSFRGVTVTLENNSIWKQFCECGTEMILTKQGRRMFPYCRYRLSGLEPDRMYNLVLSIVPSSLYKYRWSTSKWEASGPAEHQAQGLIRAFPHHHSPCRGSEWMSCLVSFYKLKLTNFFQDQEGHMILHSMHRYIPRLHIIPVLDGEAPTADKPVVVGPESITFTFPQTEFMAVTTYQNFRITQLKINHNPFAKGFREDGNNPRLNRILPLAVKAESQTEVLKAAEPKEQQEEGRDPSDNSELPSAASATAEETRLVLKPVMSDPSSSGDTYVPCIRGKHALGELVLVQNQPGVEPEKEDGTAVPPTTNSGLTLPPKPTSNKPGTSKATQGISARYRKKRRRKVKTRWTMYHPKTWKRAAASAKVTYRQSLTVAMQPELDDIEGLLFVSFTSKEALEVHIKDRLANTSSSELPVSLTGPMETKTSEDVSMGENPETAKEKTARLESLLLDDLSVLKHKQVIHPVLQEVGLKLSTLDPATPVDLKYLGVCLPLPPSSPHGQSSAPAKSPADEDLQFISRTGKTRDVTKIKGWRNKFTTSQETSASNGEGLQKNLSAFCSNMLDEYLESEAQQISERAAAFSTNPEDTVAYQLPEKSSSYVKTLDSVLRHQGAASRASVRANRPCPLSRKTFPHSAQMSPGVSPTTPEAPSQLPDPDPEAAAGSSEDQSQRLSSSQSGANQRPVLSFGQSQGPPHKGAGFSKIQLKVMQMETAAFNQGLSRTRLTPERLSTALSVIMSTTSMPREIPFQDNTVGAQCGQEFCRLGCVCHSLQQLHTTRDHCGQPECLFTCSCFKPTEESATPRPSSHAGKLWNHSVNNEDLEPLYTPKSAPAPPKAQKTWTFSPAPPIREEDKDPVYKYLESMMTCARVREFNSLPPPVVTLDPGGFQSKDKPAPQNDVKQENVAPATDQKPVKRPSLDADVAALKARKQIEIQSMCQWKTDSKMVLEGLWERMNQNQLHLRFYVGPYCICPVARVILKKPSGNLIIYRLRISKPEKVNGCEDESEDGEEKCDDRRCDGNTEEETAENLWIRYGLIPHQRGTMPVRRLRAQRKPSGRKASGLIQVNDKCYNHATLLLGNMGSLHPANRLAARVTGRLGADKTPPTQQSANTTTTPESNHFNATNTSIPQPAYQKRALLPKADLLKPDPLNNGASNTVQDSQRPQFLSTSAQSFFPFQQNIHSSSASSPVSLTVSPSLKSPSFLAESGTYSFRICPPSTHAGDSQKPSGVPLPGGFTLIQLPKPGAEEKAKPPDATCSASAQNKDSVSNLSTSAGKWFGFDTLSKVRTLLSSDLPEPDSSSGRPPEEKMLLDGNSEEEDPLQTENQQDLYFDMSSEELSSDFSDYDECEEQDEMVDIETVEAKQGELISEMRKDALSRQQSRDFAGDRELNEAPTGLKPCEMSDDQKNTRARWNHSAVEKLRRCEQRVLFDRLQSLLKLDSKSSRLHVLELAVKEIDSLGKTSRYLQAEKERLLQAQSVFLKQLSVLAGKPVDVIQSKLKEIFERQKQREKNMQWKPFFSHLLQSKAALLQATAAPTDLKPSSPPQDVSPPGHPGFSEAAKSNLQTLMSRIHSSKSPGLASDQSNEDKSMQGSQPKAVTVVVPVQGTSPPQVEVQQKEPEAVDHPPSKLDENQEVSKDPDQSSTPTSVTKDSKVLDKLANTVAAATSGPTGTIKRTIVVPARPVALPLIRSKTGRLILPSSLKPFGKGYYTLMVMESKKKEDGDTASSPATADLDPSKNSEKSAPPPEQPSDPESGSAAVDKPPAPSDSDPKSSGVASPLTELTFLNKSIAVPSLSRQATEEGKGEALPIFIRTSATRFCLKPVGKVPASATGEQNSRPLFVTVLSSKPAKSPAAPPSTDASKTEVEQTEVAEGNVDGLTGLKQDDVIVKKIQVRVQNTPGTGGEMGDKPSSVKRCRGRSSAKTRGQGRGSAVRRAKSPDSPVKFPSRKSTNAQNSEEEATSRPLTRGSLGKDFPSAKKRSWIDVEKELELEPDLELV
ncbi:uncharacterized protein magl isoform X2 [Fundulus heteroclitus]|uniref:uncharacterized protein magl isoform X2 n=1 Tax=Fundulus heteroclitus TaxID=8078 RepID=UPI00165A8B87|nr:uncharacterized protein magl isoform X2 [Fundulus heteroclitus]